MKRHLLIVASLAICSCAFPGMVARASYSVHTDSTSSAGNSNVGTAGGRAYYDSATGAVFVNSSSGPGVATDGGSPNTLGLKSSNDNSSASVLGATGSASGSADLASGRVRAYGTSTNTGPSGLNNSGEMISEINDTLHFSVAGANSSTVTDVPVTFTMDGVPSLVSNQYNGFDVNFTGQIGGGSTQFDYSTASNPPTTLNQYGWASQTTASATPSSFIFNATFAITGQTLTTAVDLKLLVFTQFGNTADYLNTGSISFDLPSNVTFTSDSGVFLTSTPEPAIGLIAFASYPFFMRRRSARA